MIESSDRKEIIESMRKNDYHTISASNDNHMKLMRTGRKSQNKPVIAGSSLKVLIIALNTLIAIILSTVFNANILVIAYLTASVIAIIGFIVRI